MDTSQVSRSFTVESRPCFQTCHPLKIKQATTARNRSTRRELPVPLPSLKIESSQARMAQKLMRPTVRRAWRAALRLVIADARSVASGIARA